MLGDWNLNEYEQWLVNNNEVLKLWSKALKRKDR